MLPHFQCRGEANVVGKLWQVRDLGQRRTPKFELEDDQELEVVEEATVVTPLSSLTEEQKQPVDGIGVVRRVADGRHQERQHARAGDR